MDSKQTSRYCGPPPHGMEPHVMQINSSVSWRKTGRSKLIDIERKSKTIALIREKSQWKNHCQFHSLLLHPSMRISLMIATLIHNRRGTELNQEHEDVSAFSIVVLLG